MGLADDHEEMADLVAAYAIDALDPVEAVTVEAHLAQCAECRALLDAHRETASWLAELADAEADEPAPFDRLASVIAEPPPPLRLRPVPADADGSSGRPRSSARTFAIAAGVVIALGAGVVVGAVSRSSSPAKASLAQVAVSAAASPGARDITLSNRSGSGLVRVVLTRAGVGYLRRSDLPSLGAGRTYQLWGVVDGSAISLGVLGPHPGVSQFRVPPGAAAIAITDEVAGGVVRPTQTPVAEATLS